MVAADVGLGGWEERGVVGSIGHSSGTFVWGDDHVGSLGFLCVSDDRRVLWLVEGTGS